MLTLAEVIEATNEERSLSRSDVPARVQAAHIWQAMVSLPGCLPHSSMVARSKADCAAFLRDYASEEEEEGRVPRDLGRTIKAATRANGGRCYYGKRYAYELVSMTVGELF